MQDNESTKFGFKTVNAAVRQSLVNDIFSNIAAKYDLMNDIMSFGVHRLWKDRFCTQIDNLNSKILDCAAGSGDIAFRIINRARARSKTPRIVMCDVNQDMLNIASDQAINRNLFEYIEIVCANAEELPFDDDSFDCYVIAFGIRNVQNQNKALKEAIRVLKPGGKFLCLEFSKVQSDVLQAVYNFYSFNVIPTIGNIVTGNSNAYRYLVESINMFPDQEAFKSMICDAGFINVSYQNLSHGIAAVHSAYKL